MTRPEDAGLLAQALALAMPADDEGPTWDARVEAWRIGTLPAPRQHAVWVRRYAYTWAIIVGPPDAGWYADRWCYTTREDATTAALAWLAQPGAEPDGWHRHPTTGRRRPDGNADAEYVEP